MTNETLFTTPNIEIQSLPGGGSIVRSRDVIPPFEPRLVHHLETWARTRPTQSFLQERSGEAWRGVSYEDAYDRVRRLAAGLLGLSVNRPVMVLSGNSIDHAMIGLAAQMVGVPYVPVSAPYSLLSKDFSKLRAILRKVEPGLVYVDRASAFARALAIEEIAGATLVATDPTGVSGVLSLKELETETGDGQVERAAEAVDPDAPGKLLFTSGSTGHQGRDPHPPDDGGQSGTDGRAVAVPATDPAGPAGLASMESCLWQQPQSRDGAAPWRHDVAR